MPSPKLAQSVDCLLPLSGIAVLFVLGWIVDYVLPDDIWTSVTSRFAMLVAGVIGWALGVIAHRRQLHCGGTQPLLPLSTEVLTRLVQLVVVTLLCLTCVFLALLKDNPIIALVFLAIILVSIIGEVGWANPLCGMWRVWSDD